MIIKIHNLTWYVDLVSNDKISVVEDGKSKDKLAHPTPNQVPRNDFDPCGVTFKSKLLIFINSDLPEDLFKRTIDHEITHAFSWSYGLSQFDTLNEEQLCDFMETHGRDIIKMSDKVYNHLIKKKHKLEKAIDLDK